MDEVSNYFVNLLYLFLISRTMETIEGFFNLLMENPSVSVSILVNEDEENLSVFL